MSRATLAAFALAVLAAVVAGLLAASGFSLMPSYLAAWLAWMAVPLGALPLVMGLEAFGVSETGTAGALLPALRRLLPLLPIGALLAIPMLLGAAPFHRAGLADGLPAAWMRPDFFTARMVAMLLTWSVFSIVFLRKPAAPRRGLAIIGLMLHLVLGSIAAVDWVLSLDPGIASSSIGLLLIAAQMGAALCVAVFGLAVFGDAGRTDAPAITAAMMTTLLAVWLFLHFTQYLVIWSANLPGEIVWYQHRGLGLGGPAIWFAATAAAIGLVALALLTLTPNRSPRMAAVMASVAAMLLLAHLVEMFWLVTPAFRHRFTLAAPDLPALLGFGGLAVGVVLAIEAFARRRRGHVATQ